MDKRGKIVIVGGGTAGWLTALFFSRYLATSRWQIVLVESTTVGPIGVGEGTTGLFTTVMRDPRFGLEETEFLHFARATLKLGIKHQDWRELGNSYFGPIDNPADFLPSGSNGFPLLQAHAIATGHRVADVHLNGLLMASGRVPLCLHDGLAEFIPSHAYHFDATAVASFLADRCVKRGVQLIKADVCNVEQLSSGYISAVRLADGRIEPGDFFVDCSGFARLLCQRTLMTPWRSYRAWLPVNRAITFFMPHAADTDIRPYTLAWARSSGWIWCIPTVDRIGCGYVFDSNVQTQDRAHQEAEEAFGQPLDVRRVISFDSGRLEQFWVKNCVAIGLSAAFSEPLEATSLHATLVQLMALCRTQFWKYPTAHWEAYRSLYNRQIGSMFDDFRDFLALHYRSGRRDSPFWRELGESRLPDWLAEQLTIWAHEFPSPEHFADTSGAVSPQLYLPVLDGLGLLSPRSAIQSLKERSLTDAAGRSSRMVGSLLEEIAKSAVHHRTALIHLTRRCTPPEEVCQLGRPHDDRFVTRQIFHART